MIEPESLRKLLSANIKKHRKRLGFSQEKLAEAASLSAQTINDIEGCRMWVSDKTIAKLSDALHVEAYQLLLPDVPNIEHAGNSAAFFSAELLLSLQEKLKKSIDSHFGSVLRPVRSTLLP